MKKLLIALSVSMALVGCAKEVRQEQANPVPVVEVQQPEYLVADHLEDKDDIVQQDVQVQDRQPEVDLSVEAESEVSEKDFWAGVDECNAKYEHLSVFAGGNLDGQELEALVGKCLDEKGLKA